MLQCVSRILTLCYGGLVLLGLGQFLLLLQLRQKRPQKTMITSKEVKRDPKINPGLFVGLNPWHTLYLFSPIGVQSNQGVLWSPTLPQNRDGIGRSELQVQVDSSLLRHAISLQRKDRRHRQIHQRRGHIQQLFWKYKFEKWNHD